MEHLTLWSAIEFADDYTIVYLISLHPPYDIIAKLKTTRVFFFCTISMHMKLEMVQSLPILLGNSDFLLNILKQNKNLYAKVILS